MHEPLSFRHLVALAFLLLPAGDPAVYGQAESPAAEKALWSLWKNHLEQTEDHAGIIAACRAYRRNDGGDPFARVCDGLKAWHLLKTGDRDGARTLLEEMEVVPDSSATPLQSASGVIARSWLTRLDREQVKQSLQKIYLADVRYPASLEAISSLHKQHQAPLTDRWYTPWGYRLTGFRTLPGLNDQKYELRSTRLGARSDLTTVLAEPYAAWIRIRPVKLVSNNLNKEIVQFKTTSSKRKTRDIYLSAGTTSEAISFAYKGTKILIVSDSDYWHIMTMPK